jgi:hypothetical protein
LAISDEQGTKGLEALGSFRSTLLLVVLLNLRGTFTGWPLDSFGVPDKFLQQIALILHQNKVPCARYNVSNIVNDLVRLFREIFGWIGERVALQQAVQCDIDLFVLEERRRTESISALGRICNEAAHIPMEPCRWQKLFVEQSACAIP